MGGPLALGEKNGGFLKWLEFLAKADLTSRQLALEMQQMLLDDMISKGGIY